MTYDWGLFGPDSITWRVHAEPILWFAGYRALLLQSLHPRALAGVLQNSNFREDPWGRLLRTARFYGEVIYGSTEQAQKAGNRVRRMHARLGGTDPDSGEAFRVDEPELLRWIYVTATESFCDTAQRAGLGLSPAEVDGYYDEQRTVATMVGLDRSDVPGTAAGDRGLLRVDPPGPAGRRRRAVGGPVPRPAHVPVGAGLDPRPSTVGGRLRVRVQPAAGLGPPPVRAAGPARHRPRRHADVTGVALGHPGGAAARDRGSGLPRRDGPGGAFAGGVDHPERRRQRDDEQDKAGRDHEGQAQVAQHRRIGHHPDHGRPHDHTGVVEQVDLGDDRAGAGRVEGVGRRERQRHHHRQADPDQGEAPDRHRRLVGQRHQREPAGRDELPTITVETAPRRPMMRSATVRPRNWKTR